jgi:hypothetical protein
LRQQELPISVRLQPLAIALRSTPSYHHAQRLKSGVYGDERAFSFAAYLIADRTKYFFEEWSVQ